MAQYNTIWHNMVQYGTIWYNMAQYGTIWHNMVQYGTILQSKHCQRHNGARCPLPTDSGVEYFTETYTYDNFGNYCANYKLGWSGLTKGNIMTD